MAEHHEHLARALALLEVLRTSVPEFSEVVVVLKSQLVAISDTLDLALKGIEDRDIEIQRLRRELEDSRAKLLRLKRRHQVTIRLLE